MADNGERKIKNKVLKLELSVLALEIEIAQGDDGRQDKLAEQQKKLDNNVKTDQDSAGQQSTSVNFEGTSQP